MTLRPVLWSWLALGPLMVGCASQPSAVTERDDLPSEQRDCVTDDDCSDATCDHEFGVCVATRGDLDSLLFEITPASSDARFGGLKIFHTASELATASDDALVVNVPEPVLVQGEVQAHPKQQLCTGKAARTLPVELEFRPRERVLGIEAPVYVARTVPVDFEYRFSDLALPPGVYDIYVRPLDAAGALTAAEAVDSPPCDIVPQLFRGVVIEEQSSAKLELKQTEPVDLLVRIPFEERMEGWVIDVIHPTSGERISTRVTLRGADAGLSNGSLIFEAPLQYSLVSGADFVRSDQQLVRLSPPADVVEPTTLYYRSGLEVFKPGEAILGSVGPFQPVTFHAWVWADGQPDAAVEATVHFSVVKLDGVLDGVFTDFRRSVEVDESGEVLVTLLPGTYRVRTIPKSLLQGVSALESFVTVREPAPGESDSVQAGHVFAVPAASHIRAQVRLAGGGGAVGVSANALPASPQTICLADPDATSGKCGALLPGVLSGVLAQDAFRPRAISSLVGEDGILDIAGADCGTCEPERGALFDLVIRPEASSGYGWKVVRGIQVTKDISLGQIQLRPAVVQRGSLTFDGSEALPGALVRAYALLDAEGRYIREPGEMPLCAESAGEPSPAGCVATALQIAESRVDSDGVFVLPIPMRLE